MNPKRRLLGSKFSRLNRVVRRIVAPAPMIIGIASLAITGLLVGVRQLGGLQPLELAAFDLMVRVRPDEGPDPRLLVVAITETDIKAQKQYPLSDLVLAQLLEQLERYQPKVIGLDLARNVPKDPGRAELKHHLQNPKLIAITFIGNSDSESVPPPPGVPEERVGFSDVVTDPDSVIRRNLMYASTETATLYSFSLRLALAYLAQKNIVPELTQTNQVQLNKTIFPQLLANSGGYQSIDAQGYQILLNYRSAYKIARQVTLTQVLNGQIDPNWVKDKIVLIGTTAPTVKDSFYTPYSATEQGNPQMAGVLVHAQMASQILSAVLDNRPLFWFWSEWVEVLWIAGWSLISAILLRRIHNPFLLGFKGIAIVGVLLGLCYVLFLHEGWVPVAAPALAIVITGSAVVASQLQQSKRKEQMVMNLLGQQTSPEIAKALWNERDHLLHEGLLPGRSLTATMLLTDLKGFSTISEKMRPAAVMAWLNEYLGAMTQEVQNHHGIINKFTGDGILAVFGVPVPRTTSEEIGEDARRAVACAMAMGDRLQELNQDWLARGLPVVQMRVGIFTGPVMVGSLGGKERLEYGVIGDSVNIASRLESCEKDQQPSTCRVLIAHETLVHLQGQFRVESWGSLSLKGKQQKVDVYRVVASMPDGYFSSLPKGSSFSVES